MEGDNSIDEGEEEDEHKSSMDIGGLTVELDRESGLKIVGRESGPDLEGASPSLWSD